MTPQELKNSILQLAIQGKLVEQRPEEGTAEELYRQIQDEKQRLIKAGNIKKEKLLPEITEDEKPFEIPESWKWVRLGDIYKLLMGQSPDGKNVSESTTGIEFHQGKVFFGEDYLHKSNQVTNKPTKVAEPFAVLLCVRAPVGIVNITEREICIGRGLCAVSTFASMDAKYVLYSLRSCKTDFIKKATGTTFIAITGEVVKNQVVPLPPLAEQKRIVAKIEELLPYIDRYEQAWSKLEDFNKRFPTDMQKSILQTAIQGKLVEQRPEEGTGEELYLQIQDEKQRLIKEGTIKKEKPLPEITEDENPFDIPENWKWVRLGDLLSVRGGKRLPIGSNLTTTQTKHVYIRVTDMQRNTVDMTDLHYITDDVYNRIRNYIITKNDLYIVIVGSTIGKVGSIPEQLDGMNLTENAARLTPLLIDKDYLLRTLQTEFLQNQFIDKTHQVGQPKLALMRLKTAVVPLPPLAEQKRIVAKLEEILPLCERLK